MERKTKIFAIKMTISVILGIVLSYGVVRLFNINVPPSMNFPVGFIAGAITYTIVEIILN